MYWETEEEEARRLFPGDFVTEEDEEWCDICERYCSAVFCQNGLGWCHDCHEKWLAEEAEADRLDAEEDRLAEFERLYDEALEQDRRRNIDAELEAEEAKRRADDEFYASFSLFWYNVLGWDNYIRFAAPVLLRLHYIKQGWRR